MLAHCFFVSDLIIIFTITILGPTLNRSEDVLFSHRSPSSSKSAHSASTRSLGLRNGKSHSQDIEATSIFANSDALTTVGGGHVGVSDNGRGSLGHITISNGVEI